MCDDFSGRWDNLNFWRQCLSAAEALEERWGGVHRRKFGAIKASRQCSSCKLVCSGGSRYRRLTHEEIIYFSKFFFGEYKTEASDLNLTRTQLPDVKTEA